MSKSEREAELEDRVDELEETVQKMLPSRRDMLAGSAVAGAGLLGFGAGTASADGHNDGDTQWGTDTNRDDYLVDHLNANSIGADEGLIGELNDKTYLVAPSLNAGYDTVQAAHNAIETNHGNKGGVIELVETVSETGIEFRVANLTLRGRGGAREQSFGTVAINAAGGNGIDITQDATESFTADNIAIVGDGSTSYAIRATNHLQDCNFRDVFIEDCVDGFQILGGSCEHNLFDYRVRGVSGWAFKVDFSSSSDFFNQNTFIRAQSIRCGDSSAGTGGGMLLQGVSGSEIAGNVVTQLLSQTDEIPIRIGSGPNFVDNEFRGYGLEGDGTGQPWEVNVSPSTSARNNIWTANITPNKWDSSQFDRGLWSVFKTRSGISTHSPEEVGFSDKKTVGTSLTTLFTDPGGNSGGIVMVSGDDQSSSARFYDIVHYSRTGGTSVISQIGSNGPATRSYGTSAGDFEMAMGSGTYDVSFGRMISTRPFN